MNKQIILVSFLVFFLFITSPAAAGNNLCVNTPSSCSGAQYSTISEAITSAAGGDTIYVGPGLYNERITINKAITLNGATAGVGKKGYNVPENYAYNSATESIIQPSTLADQPVVQITVGNVTFDGFVVAVTVAKTYPTYAQTNLIQMYSGGNLNNVTIQNNVLGPVTNLTDQDGNSGRMVIAISKHSPGTGQNNVTNLQIRNNKIFDAKGDGCGILMIGTRNTSTDAVTPSIQYQYKGAIIDNNEISGNHRSGIDFSAGVQGGPAAADHIRITNNLISNNGWNITDKDNIKWGNGIVMIRMTNQLNDILPWASRYIDIENNEFSGNEKNAIYIGPITRDVTIKSNIIRNNGAGTSPSGVTGFSRWDGIRIDLDETYQIEELARHPEQGTYSGQKIYDYLTNVVIGENQISGNGGYGLMVIRTPLNGTVDGRKNWWGASSGPLNTASNPSGAGDRVSDNVRFSPWYTSTAKILTQSAAAGDGAILYVSPNNFTTIQRAINAAWPGDTIRVFPGIYDERIVINKSLTLLGATNGASKKDYVVPAGYAYDATKESILKPSTNMDAPVVKIELGSTTFNGFVVLHDRVNQYPDRIYPETHLIAVSNQSHDYTDLTIKNNVIGPNTNTGSQDGTKGRSGIAVYGPSAALVRNLTIVHNLIFDAKGDGCGIQLLGSVNSTEQTRTSLLGLTGKYRGSVIDNNTITGNHRAGIELNGGTQGGAATADHFRISNNTISNNGWGGSADKNNLKFGNGIMLIHVRSDRENPYSWGSQYVDIDNNLIIDNEKNGIYLGPVNRNITVTNNTIRNNGAGTGNYKTWDGIQIDLDESYHDPIFKNYGYLSNITISANEINASGDYGIQVIKSPALGSIDARNNWWGDASGPKSAKNPSGKANRVSNNVAFSPWYSNPSGLSASIPLPLPLATFTVSPFEDVAGSTFSFDASASESMGNTSIETYQWDYGDGNTSVASASPFRSYRYNSSKVYTITLLVKGYNGMSNKTTRQVTVIAKKEAIALTFNGTSVSGTTGEQKITIDSTKINGTMTNSTKEVKIENPSNGWSEMVVKGNTSGGNGAPVTVEDITEVVLKSKPSVTELDTTSSEGAAGPGSVTTSIQLSLKEFASAPLQVEVTQGANTTVSDAFQIAAGSDKKVDAVAYTMTIKGSSMINSNLSSSSEPVILNMSVSEAWVKEHGGIDAIKAIRYSDNGDTKEVLETQYQFSAGIPVMYYFKIISPHGCSVFGIASISAVPPSSASSGNIASSSPVSGSGGGGSGGGSFTSKDQAPEKRAPLQPKEEVPVVPHESSAPVQPQHTFAAPIVTPDVVEEIPLAGPAEAGLKRMLAPIFAFIIENIIAIGVGAATIVLCVALVIWHRRRRQYWM